MSSNPFQIYEENLKKTSTWLLSSFRKHKGGSSAYFSPIIGWSKPYPETTGYLIPTLLRLANWYDDNPFRDKAIKAGDWLLSLQSELGFWPGGLYSANAKGSPSVFNTGQILKGMCALFTDTQEDKWLKAAHRGAEWLSQGINNAGEWKYWNYENGYSPSYYTQVAWPMLEVWKLTQESNILESAKRALQNILNRRRKNGIFLDWGFKKGAPAFSHTIAYTLRGFIESGRILNDWNSYGRPIEKAMNVLIRKCELNGGLLPGAFTDDWKSISWYSCLTGNAQLAICLLEYEKKMNDLRIVSTAARLIDSVIKSQRFTNYIPNLKGAVAGSFPIWGSYMILRYPNWAAKYLADAIMCLIKRLQKIL